MYARILAGVDGSEQGAHALRHTAALAKALGAELRIVHVVDSVARRSRVPVLLVH